MRVVIEVNDKTGALTLGSDVQMEPMRMHWFLTIAQKILLDGLNAPPKPAVQAVPASALRRIDGGLNGSKPE